jgi:D-3-phosphoglycerate dehydrogenase / 2-oxoglutarate reductase
MDRFKVALVALNNQLLPGWLSESLARAGVDLVVHDCKTRAELAHYAGDADVVWVMGGHECLYAENLDVIPRCGAIVRAGSGTDNVPVAEATALGIVVANTPAATSDSVSDHVIGLLFALTRQVALHDRLVRQGLWSPKHGWPDWHVHGKSLGLVGFGHIPRRLVKKLSGFEMTVRAYDPFVSAEEMARHGAQTASLKAVMAESDFVSVHCPLTKDTWHLIGENELRWMKPKALLLNTSRGPVIDEAALVRALSEGGLAGAGLDVFEQEPVDPNNPLLKMNNVVVTPHIGGYSDESFDLFWQLSLETVLDLSAGRWPRSCVNRGVKPRWTLS